MTYEERPEVKAGEKGFLPNPLMLLGFPKKVRQRKEDQAYEKKRRDGKKFNPCDSQDPEQKKETKPVEDLGKEGVKREKNQRGEEKREQDTRSTEEAALGVESQAENRETCQERPEEKGVHRIFLTAWRGRNQ